MASDRKENTMRRLVLALILGVAGWGGAALSAHPVLAATLCVGSGAGCYPTLGAALAASHDGDVIQLGPGIFAGGVTIATGVTIVGAGAGATVIHGAGNGPVLTIGQFNAAPQITVAIRSVTIQGGHNTSWPSPYRASGGGIAVSPGPNFTPGATLTVTDSVITHNTVTPQAVYPNPGGPYWPRCGANLFCPYAEADGGGIDSWGTVTLIDTAVTDNLAGTGPSSDADGGGINSWLPTSLTLRDSRVDRNEAVVAAPNGRFAEGGGIALRSGTLDMQGGSLSDNAALLSNNLSTAPPANDQLAVHGGGIHDECQNPPDNCSTTSFANVAITGNRAIAVNAGGDVSADSGAFHADGTITITDSSVIGNTVSATSAFPSGAAEADSGAGEINWSSTVSNSRFAGNTVTAKTAGGPANASCGSISPTAFPGLTQAVTGSMIEGNSVQALSATGSATAFGGGMVTDAASALAALQNTTVRGNSASASGAGGSVQGGGIWNGDLGFGLGPGVLTLSSTTITGNSLTAPHGFTVQGGGLFTAYPVTATNATIIGNTPTNCSPPNAVPGCTG
jgi:hypothetical protein